MHTADEIDVIPVPKRSDSMARVLTVLQESGDSMTASNLMPRTDMSRQGVLAVCDALIALGLVVETKSAAPRSATGVGRPSRTFALNARAGFVVGIELGPERIAAQVCDLRGDIVISKAVEHRAPVQSVTGLIEKGKRIIDDLVAEADLDPGLVSTVAVGVPAPVDRNGVAGGATRVPGLSGTNVIDAFSAGRNWTVLADNDANLAVIGERWRGAAEGFDGVILLLVEERLGAGIIDSGRIVRGGNGFAGQMEFVTLLEGARGTWGIVPLTARLLEEVSEADRIRITTAPSAARPAAIDGRIVGPAEVEAVFDAARGGDPVACAVVDTVADRLARVTAVLVTLLDPDIVVFGSDIPRDAEALLQPVRHKLAGLMDREPPSLARSALRDQAVATGAVRWALDHAHERLIP